MTKPSLPSQSARLVDLRNDSKSCLFGDSIAAAVKFLQKENKKTTIKPLQSPRRGTGENKKDSFSPETNHNCYRAKYNTTTIAKKTTIVNGTTPLWVRRVAQIQAHLKLV